MKIPTHFTNEELNESIDILDLSTRTGNCLKRGKITTVGELIDKFDSLRLLKNFGKTCQKEINSKIFEMQLTRLAPEDVPKYLMEIAEAN